jgi:glycosyltransferase involved in cell wall biosynthesis
VKDKLRIVHVIPSLARGGAERLAIDICSVLHKRPDVEYRLVVLSTINQYKELTQELNVVYCPVLLKTFRLQDHRNHLDEWGEFLRSFKPHIIHSHIFFADLASRAFLQHDAKYFSHLHGRTTQFEKPVFKFLFTNPKEYFRHLAQRKYILKKHQNSGTHFFVVSKHYQGYLEKTLGYKKNVTLLPNAFDFERFYTKALKIQDGKLKLISAGRLVKHKNHVFLLAVCQELKKLNVAFQLEILGDGPLKNELEEQIKLRNLEGLVFLRGMVEKPENFYRENHFYIHSASDEPFGLTILEGMAAGLPVITLDGKGNRELIHQNRNGFMFFKQDPETFSRKLIELFNSKTLFQQMSYYSQEFAKNYDIKNYVDRLIEIYKYA